MIHTLSRYVFLNLLKEWFTAQEVCNLDSAYSSKKFRTNFLDALRLCDFGLHNSKMTILDLHLAQWLKLRNLNVQRVVLCDLDIYSQQNILENYKHVLKSLNHLKLYVCPDHINFELARLLESVDAQLSSLDLEYFQANANIAEHFYISEGLFPFRQLTTLKLKVPRLSSVDWVRVASNCPLLIYFEGRMTAAELKSISIFQILEIVLVYCIQLEVFLLVACDLRIVHQSGRYSRLENYFEPIRMFAELKHKELTKLHLKNHQNQSDLCLNV